MLKFYLSFVAAAAVAAAEYAFDSTWHTSKAVPKAAGIGVSHGTVFVATESDTPVYVFSKSGEFKASFGASDIGKAHGIAIERNASSGDDSVWVTDMKAGKMVKFALDGKKLATFGGNGSGKGKFDAPADMVFHNDVAYICDGDSGSDNRLTAWQLDQAGFPLSMIWQTPSEFNSPHSICYHEQMNALVVANRFAQNIKLVHPGNGTLLGTLKCDALGLGDSKPYGVRMIGNTLFVASNDGKKGHQFIHIVDFPPGMECGKLLQSIPVNKKDCATPHLLGIDVDTENVYVACLGSGGVKRLTRT